jgi:hypothetical protein
LISPYSICFSKSLPLQNIPTFTSTKELESYENSIPYYSICFSKSFPLLNIPNYMYKRARRLRKLDSPHSINSSKSFPLLNAPKCIYKRARRLRKSDSPLFNLFFKIFSFPKYSQVHLQKS